MIHNVVWNGQKWLELQEKKLDSEMYSTCNKSFWCLWHRLEVLPRWKLFQGQRLTQQVSAVAALADDFFEAHIETATLQLFLQDVLKRLHSTLPSVEDLQACLTKSPLPLGKGSGATEGSEAKPDGCNLSVSLFVCFFSSFIVASSSSEPIFDTVFQIERT